MASKKTIDLDELVPDQILLTPKSPSPQPVVGEVPAPVSEPMLVKFSNQLPANTLRRLQQFSYWSRETIGDVLTEAIEAYLAGKPEADREIPAKQAKRRRLV